MKGPLAILAGVAAAVALAFFLSGLGGTGGKNDASACADRSPLSIDELARGLEPRYSSGTLSRAELQKSFQGVEAELPEGVTYEGRIVSRARQPVAYVLVMNSSRERLAPDDVYSGFSGEAGGQTSEIPFAGQTGRLRQVPGGFSSILATGDCAAITVGGAREQTVRDISRRMRLP